MYNVWLDICSSKSSFEHLWEFVEKYDWASFERIKDNELGNVKVGFIDEDKTDAENFKKEVENFEYVKRVELKKE